MNNYYAPFQRPIGYYNPSIPTDYQFQAQMAQVPQMAQNPSAYQTPQTVQPLTQPAQIPSDFIWVLNETEAVSYPVAPNNSVTLWDKNKDTIYIKSVNTQGVPTLRTLDYIERSDAQKTTQTAQIDASNNFVSIDDFKVLQGKFDSLKSEIDDLRARQKAKTTRMVKMEEVDDE